MTCITIVGFGPVGVSVFCSLLAKISDVQRNFGSCKISIIEKSRHSAGKGLAFGTDQDIHVLNSPSQVMTLIDGEPSDFVNWLRDNPHLWREHHPEIDILVDAFLPRALFGKYVDARVRDAMTTAQRLGIDVSIIEDEAINIAPIDGQLHVTFSARDGLRTDYAILSLGLLPSQTFTELAGRKGYFHSPWPSKRLLEEVPAGENVIILGTRASAIDTSLAFSERGHRGQLWMASRSGDLPRIVGPHTPGELGLLGSTQLKETLNAVGRKLSARELLHMVGLEIEAREGREINWSNEIDHWLNAANPYESEIALIDAGVERPWQSVLNDIYPRIPDLWQALSEEGKAEFLRSHLSRWLTFQDAIPLKSARVIDGMVRRGQLEILGGIRSLKYDPNSGGFELVATRPDKREVGRFANYVVNATGPGSEVEMADSILLRNLLKAGHVVPDQFGGLGVCVDNFRARNQTETDTSIYVVGDLTRGAWLFTATLGRGRRQGKMVVEDIFDRISAAAQSA